MTPEPRLCMCAGEQVAKSCMSRRKHFAAVGKPSAQAIACVLLLQVAKLLAKEAQISAAQVASHVAPAPAPHVQGAPAAAQAPEGSRTAAPSTVTAAARRADAAAAGQPDSFAAAAAGAGQSLLSKLELVARALNATVNEQLLDPTQGLEGAAEALLKAPGRALNGTLLHEQHAEALQATGSGVSGGAGTTGTVAAQNSTAAPSAPLEGSPSPGPAASPGSAEAPGTPAAPGPLGASGTPAAPGPIAVAPGVVAPPNVHTYLDGALTVVDPALFYDASAKIISTLNGVVGTLSFINFSPCALVSAEAGMAAYALGAVIEPTVIYIAPEGLSLAAVGLSISPTGIAVGPGRVKTLAEGFAIAPTLISIAPVVDTDAQIGKDISGVPGKIVQLPRKPEDQRPAPPTDPVPTAPTGAGMPSGGRNRR